MRRRCCVCCGSDETSSYALTPPARPLRPSPHPAAPLPRSAAALAAVALAAGPEQIHIAYAPTGGFAVDFVSPAPGPGAVRFGLNASGPFARANTSSLAVASIGTLHQARFAFAGAAPGQRAYYPVTAAGLDSAVFELTPVVARAEVFAVFGDFGLRNDESMTALVAEAQAGVFDSVLHVGDWAYKHVPILDLALPHRPRTIRQRTRAPNPNPTAFQPGVNRGPPRPNLNPPQLRGGHGLRHAQLRRQQLHAPRAGLRGGQAHHARRRQPRGLPGLPGRAGH